MPNVPEIVTHPLGLVGFVLALVFALAARRRETHGWVRPLTYMLSLVVAIGGLGLAYQQTSDEHARVAAKTMKNDSAQAAATPEVNIAVSNNQGQVIGIVQGDLSIDARPAKPANKASSPALTANP